MSGDPLLIRFGEASIARKILSTYIPALKDGVILPIHPSFQVLMESGRTSCREPNLQNPPREGGVRECFIPRLGFVLVSSDYDSAELRALGQACLDLMGYSELAKWYQRDPNFDPHTLLAADLMHVSYEEALVLKKAGDRTFKHRRQFAKSANFGFPGGLAARTFVAYSRAQGITITPKESEDLRAAWFTRWSEMRGYFDAIQTMLGTREMEDGTILQFRSNRVRGNTRYTAACNSMFQGPVADGGKLACFLVAKECYTVTDSALYGCRPVMFLHDEIIMEAPEERAHEAAERLSKVMVAALQAFLPDVPVTASPALMRRWYKKAETVRGPDGRLIPWEPVVEKEKREAA